MKKVFLAVMALGLSTVIFAQKKAADVAKFKTETIDLGKIKQANPTTATFQVTNIGSDPLIIEQANPTCGCTISNYTKEPIAAGKNGEINATYNAAGLGAFEKHLTVKFAGVDEVKSITIKGEVLNADDFAKLNGGTTTTTTTSKTTETKTAAPVATPAPMVKMDGGDKTKMTTKRAPKKRTSKKVKTTKTTTTTTTPAVK